MKKSNLSQYDWNRERSSLSWSVCGEHEIRHSLFRLWSVVENLNNVVEKLATQISNEKGKADE